MAVDGFFSILFNRVIFFLFSVVFFDPSSSCLLVWTRICCQTVVEIRSERQHERQGE